MKSRSSLMMPKAAENLEYDRESGTFKWKIDGDVRGAVRGKIAGKIDSQGYVRIKYRGVGISAHRLAWFIAYGEEPLQIDHINMNKADNRLCNLRVADHSQNACNRKLQPNNKTGFRGVFWNSGKRAFTAKIIAKNKTYYLGNFPTAEDAACAYEAASKRLHADYRYHVGHVAPEGA